MQISRLEMRIDPRLSKMARTITVMGGQTAFAGGEVRAGNCEVITGGTNVASVN
jgi:hypothetical protein